MGVKCQTRTEVKYTFNVLQRQGYAASLSSGTVTFMSNTVVSVTD